MTTTESVDDTRSPVPEEADVAEPDTPADGDGPVEGEAKDSNSTPRRSISVSIRALSLGLLILGLVVALGVMSWLYLGAEREVDTRAQQVRDDQHAEQVALDYAVRAAIMNYQDLGPWKLALVEGTTPELNKKLADAANAMEQILLPLQWSSTAKPLAAKVRSNDNGVYVVDSFVSVMTKTVQAADNLQSTATYAVTVDSSDNWVITDVGGIGQVVGDR